MEKVQEKVLEKVLVLNNLLTERYYIKRKKLKDTEADELFNWLDTAIILAKKVKDVLELLPPELWANYKMFKIQRLQEQILLTQSEKLLREFLKKKPKILKKGGKHVRKSKLQDQKSPEGSPQPG